jgi:hypothetical protein
VVDTAGATLVIPYVCTALAWLGALQYHAQATADTVTAGVVAVKRLQCTSLKTKFYVTRDTFPLNDFVSAWDLRRLFIAELLSFLD